ncbi:uncharacterized protein LOC143914854 [Arctopsyche grandis]|uniref:uncharacterized protein LOC143914854 n=1 Tax=Arctopsyche grandis TaxID=121162 RepID=UPI00406D96A4
MKMSKGILFATILFLGTSISIADVICTFGDFRSGVVRCIPGHDGVKSLLMVHVLGNKQNSYIDELHIKNCKLLAISGNVFKQFRNIYVLDLSHNVLVSLEEDVFKNLVELRTLNVSHNALGTIDAKVFQPLTKLQDLDMSHNFLSTPSAESIFSGLASLRALDISNNAEILSLPSLLTGLKLKSLRISRSSLTLPEIYDIAMPDLIYLDMSSNNQLYFNGDASAVTQKCPDLLYMYLSNIQMKTIDSNFFTNNRMLIFIDLSKNLLKAIHEELFSANEELLSLDLSQNNLNRLPRELFRKTIRLLSLHLNDNDIERLPSDIFDSLKNMRILNLANNKIESLQSTIFSKNRNLNTVYLDGNRIKEINPYTFAANSQIRVLALSNNLLERFNFRVISTMENLLQLSLDNNDLQEISSDVVKLYSLYELDLSCNKLTALSPSNVLDLITEGNRLIHLHGNPWNCACMNRLLTYNKGYVDYGRNLFSDGKYPTCIVGRSLYDCDWNITDEDYNSWVKTRKYYPNLCLPRG